MSQFCIYIRLQPFVAQFLKHSLGSPIIFPAQSVENQTIHHFVLPLPFGQKPDTGGPGMTAIAIPDSRTKPASRFNHITARGKQAMVECCEALFMRSLWSELGHLDTLSCKTTTAIYAWCEGHGIDIEYADTIRQRYYRLRNQYRRRGIDLMKKTRVQKD